MQTCMKPNMYSSKYNKWMYQWMGDVAQHVHIHPNVFTSMNICIDILLIGLIYYQKLSYITLFIIMILHTLLDFFDGCLARVQKKTSKLGGILDNIADLGYYIPLYIYVFYLIYKKKHYVLGGIGLGVLTLALILFTIRFKSFEDAIEYIGLMFEIDRDKIPHIDTDTAPFYDFVILFIIIYLIPFLIITLNN